MVVQANSDEELYAYEKGSFFTRKFTYRFYKKVFNGFYITGYLGWKIPIWNNHGKYKAMIANRIVPRFKPLD
jgi:hypothetical protein